MKRLVPKLTPLVDKYFKRLLDRPQKLFSLVETFGSPLHLLIPQNLSINVALYQDILQKYHLKGEIFYACKTNKSNSFIQAANQVQIGVEVSSLYELQKVLAQGINGKNISVSGSGKKLTYLNLAIHSGCTVSVDSISEIEKISHICRGAPKKESIQLLLRINDVIDQPSRFGILLYDLPNVYDLISRIPHVSVKGFSFHINNYSIEDRVQAISKLLLEIQKARRLGHLCSTIDIGGGFTVGYVTGHSWKAFLSAYHNKVAKKNLFYQQKNINSFYPYHSEFTKEKFLERILNTSLSNGITIAQTIKDNQLTLMLEPGRSLLDQCGLTIMEVLEVKDLKAGEKIVVVDANINHLSEQWFNTDFLVDPFLVTKKPSSDPQEKREFIASISGNTCLEMDMISWRKICFPTKPRSGDLLIYPNTAGYQMDSNESTFHHIPLPQKIVVYQDDETCHFVPESIFTNFADFM